MHTTKQVLVAGMMAAALLVASTGLASPVAHAARTVGTGVIETTAPPTRGGTIMEAEAGSTGQGPANQDECDAHAAKITRLGGELKATMLAGDGDASLAKSDELEAATDFAMDRGCFVVY